MNTEALICIICPKACHLKIEFEDQEIKRITGNQCKRGVDYAKKELINPERELSTTVLIKGAVLPLLPIRSNKALPKDALLKVMALMQKIEITAPVKKGDIIITNVLGLGVDMIASRSMGKAI